MQIDINCSTFTLGVNGMLTVQDGNGARIVCRSGSLWVTQEGETKDWVVGPDDDLTIRRSGRTVVTALEAASLTLIPPQLPGGELRRTIQTRAPAMTCG